MPVEEFEDDPGGIVFIGEGVRLIRIHMHGERIRRADSHYYIREDERTLITRCDNEYDIIVFYMGADGIHWIHMDMALRHDDSPGQLDLPFRSDQGASGRAFQVAGLADHAPDAEAPCIGHGDFYLCFLTARPKYDDLFKPSLRSHDSQALFARILPGLA